MQIMKTRLDGKGRISIPYHMRASLGINGSDTLKIETTGREIFVKPSAEGTKITARFRSFGAMLRTMKLISGRGINIESTRTMSFDQRNVEWSATLEGDARNLRLVMKRIKKMPGVRSLVVG